MTDEEGAPSEGAAFQIACCVAALAVASVAAFVPYLPTNDGPQHVLSGVLQLAYSQPGTAYQRFLEPLPEFAERGFSTLFVPLLEVASWRTALRIVLGVSAILGGASFAWLARAVAGRRTPMALLGFAIAFPWTLYMGFFPFTLATHGAVALVAYAISRAELGRRQLLVMAAGLAALSVMHVVAAVFAAGILVVVAAFRGRRQLGGMIASTIPVGVVLGAAVISGRGSASASDVPLAWPPLGDWLAALPRCLLPGPTARAVAFALLVVVALVHTARRIRAGVASAGEKAVLVCAGALLAGAVIGPRDVPGWQLVGPRLCSIAAPLALSLLGTLRVSSFARELAAAATVTATSLALTAGLHLRLSRGCEAALAGLDAPVPLDGFTLPLPLDMYCGVSREPRSSEVPYLSPLFHVGALYAAARGGLTPYILSGSPAVHAFRFRADATLPPKPDDGTYVALQWLTPDDPRRPAALARFSERAAFFEHLLVVGATRAELEDVVRRGFVPDWSNESAMLAHFRGCTIEVAIESSRARRLVVETGSRPASSSVGELTVDARGGSDRAMLRGVGCGPQWVRPYVDVDGSRAPSKGDVFCEGAGRDGRLDVDVSGSATVSCRLP